MRSKDEIRRAIREGCEEHEQTHQEALAMLREARAAADPRDVVEAAGFWLSRMAPPEQRAFA